MEHANDAVGYLKHRLPEILFWIYVWVGIGAPAIALITLVILWVKRSSLWNVASSTCKTALLHLIVLCLINVLAFAVWFVFGSLVFFGAGGSR